MIICPASGCRYFNAPARVLRAGNDMETLGTYSTSWADIRKKYKEASAMLHPDKQFGRDADSQRRTALAWQKVSDAYEKAKLELAPPPSGMGAEAGEATGAEAGAPKEGTDGAGASPRKAAWASRAEKPKAEGSVVSVTASGE